MSRSPSVSAGPGHMVQLDGLRALAVGAVVIHHYVPGGWGPGADAGVKLFFTLSGFLITGLLLKSRETVSLGRTSFGKAIGRFYARRFLRIFPLYYFVIAVALLASLPPTRELIWWLLTYTLNIHMARQGWFEAGFAHFWSLAVEEQFYLVWPWVVLSLPTRWLPVAAGAMTLTAPAYRLGYVQSGYMNMTGLSSYISTWSCLDSLGCGALLAIAERRVASDLLDRWLYRRILPGAALAYGYFCLPFTNAAGALIGFGVAQGIVFAALIRTAGRARTGRLGLVLESAPLVYIGKISYGVYVYHPFMLELTHGIMPGRLLSLPAAPWISGIASAAITLGVSSLSWFLFEGPINNLKKYFRDPA